MSNHLYQYFVAVLIAVWLLALNIASAGDGRVDATNGDVFFNVHFRFPPTTGEIADVRTALDRLALGMCDATDGQMRVKRITLSQGQPTEDQGDFWIHALPGRSGVSFFADGSGLGRLGSHVDMLRDAIRQPDVYLHEFGHHAFGLGDEYDEQSRFGGPCGIGPSFDAGTINEQNHTIMQQSGRAQCVGGANTGVRCLRDSDCPAAGGGAAGSCQLVLMSELSIASNHDPLQGDGGTCPAVTPMCPDNAFCGRVFNSTTSRYERSQQSEVHAGLSDWQTLAQNYPFVMPPAGLPAATAPATCFRAVEYVENVVGSDQVLLVLDRSGSMSWSSVVGVAEVCGNGTDDNGDGTVDEATCGDPRISFVKAAANAYLDLQRDLNVDVGVMTFNETPVLDRQIGTLNAGNIAAYKSIVNGLLPGGNTGIGDALDTSAAEFTRVATIGRSRTAYLMTDGFNTSGVDPVAAAERLRDIGVRVHVIPAGTDVSDVELGGVASATGGQLFPTPAVNELTAVYAELAARHRGAGIALPRTNFQLSWRGGTEGVRGENPRSDRETGKIPPRERAFPIFVEHNAKSLVGFVSGRNSRMTDWAMQIELRGPNGEVFGPGSPELTVDSHYLFLNVPGPAPGEWRLVARADGPALQEATAFAFIDNPDPDFFADVRPRILSGGGSVRVSGNPSWVVRLDAKDVVMNGEVTGPGGLKVPIAMSQNSTGAWEGISGPFFVSGSYTVTLALDVGPAAVLAPGEPIFDGPEIPPVDVFPFRRFATAAFSVVRGEQGFPCADPNRRDCDLDSVFDREECPQFPPDIDKDGRPNGLDPDADGDEIPDTVEGLKDVDGNGAPDMCEPSRPRTAPPVSRAQGPERQDCTPIRRALVKITQVGRDWRLTDDNLSLFDFGSDRASAQLALDILNRYAVTDLCVVGRPRPTFTYFLSNGKAPEGALAGEECTPIDVSGLTVAERNGAFEVQLGRRTLYTFAERQQADTALDLIRMHGFSQICRVGRERSSLTYMRR
jgi:hypothetical protein